MKEALTWVAVKFRKTGTSLVKHYRRHQRSGRIFLWTHLICSSKDVFLTCDVKIQENAGTLPCYVRRLSSFRRFDAFALRLFVLAVLRILASLLLHHRLLYDGAYGSPRYLDRCRFVFWVLSRSFPPLLQNLESRCSTQWMNRCLLLFYSRSTSPNTVQMRRFRQT